MVSWSGKGGGGVWGGADLASRTFFIAFPNPFFFLENTQAKKV